MSDATKRYVFAVVLLLTILVILSTRVPQSEAFFSSAWHWFLIGIFAIAGLTVLVVLIVGPIALGAMARITGINAINVDMGFFSRHFLGILSSLIVGVAWVLGAYLVVTANNWFSPILNEPKMLPVMPAWETPPIGFGIWGFVACLVTFWISRWLADNLAW